MIFADKDYMYPPVRKVVITFSSLSCLDPETASEETFPSSQAANCRLGWSEKIKFTKIFRNSEKNM